jgi:chromosome segregation ATPase
MAASPEVHRIDRNVNELMNQVRGTRQEMQSLHELIKHGQHQVESLREETIRIVEFISHLEAMYQDTQEHVRRALELVTDIHPHIRRIPELHQATQELKMELQAVKTMAADANKQLQVYARKLGPDEPQGW